MATKNTHPVAVIGAGPAGLTAAHELLRLGRGCHVLEADATHLGGLARTVTYRGYRFDIGGHRFYTKSDEVRELWHRFLPDGEFHSVRRISRIYYRGKFFDYPLRPFDALAKLGIFESMRCAASYAVQRLKPGREPISFEDWVVAAFGRRLFEIFFKTYTEKVWGMPCTEISADWAAQRIKGLSLFSAVRDALVGNGRGEVVKTLIDQFEYPRLGPGMMWEHAGRDLQGRGVPIDMGAKVVGIAHGDGLARQVVFEQGERTYRLPVSHVVSSMPLRSLVRALQPAAPAAVLKAADELGYRDFLTVALVLDEPDVFPDNWIYVHDPSVRVGRIQNFKNWSPDMVPDGSKTCLGLEYFCSEGDDLWASSDDELLALGREELGRIGLADPERIVDGTVVRMRKAYPVYDGGYAERVDTIRSYLASAVRNLQVCGRYGMHKYNNQDHAMMTALMAARNIAGGSWDQWRVNEDAEYLEEGPAEAGGRLVPLPIDHADVVA